MCKVFQMYVHLAGTSMSLAVYQCSFVCYTSHLYFVKRGVIILHTLTIGKYLSDGGWPAADDHNWLQQVAC
jgi:hypothetical protein